MANGKSRVAWQLLNLLESLPIQIGLCALRLRRIAQKKVGKHGYGPLTRIHPKAGNEQHSIDTFSVTFPPLLGAQRLFDMFPLHYMMSREPVANYRCELRSTRDVTRKLGL